MGGAGGEIRRGEVDGEVALGAAVLVLGEGGEVALVGGGAFDENFDGLVEELLAEFERVLLCKGAKAGHAPVDDGAGDVLVGPAGGGGVGAGGVGKGVDVDEADAVDDVEGLFELGVGFAGEADDDVGGDGGAVEGLREAVDHAEEVVAGVLAVHAAEDRVGAALEGEVEVGDDLGVAAEATRARA